MASQIVDDKSEHCIPFILECLSTHRKKYLDEGQQPPPFFLGLNGVQGAGKTTLVNTLCKTLRSPPHSLPTTVLSIDDFYLTHTAQVALAESQPDNRLVQHRGQPSTHDLTLGASVFAALKARQPVKIPVYDKSQFSGQGDRAVESTWEEVNRRSDSSIDVVVFEGWCVGFRPLSDAEVEEKWTEARQGKFGETQLEHHQLQDLLFINRALREYDVLTDSLHAFIHIDAEDTKYVYEWRLEQEVGLRASRGTGMTDEQIIHFVDGYYPAYELYTATLRRGIFDSGEAGRQLRLVVGRDRRVKSTQRI
ncbi:putative uridine/cytidine kinase [Lindgomyces ingoldianus]|uniref:Uridine/cytidine kinase n=1 Tax=Lindgomyces ingoldianus TaxID=673940 RepID=A0ACB6QS30_9PLEO|nr:putative uridine/cytidine kinase [Lindgomyces ingoldianus]KAF2469695.1 putative uridine/cytidine kinase [Lindgomyces ingoldianus]